MEATPYRIDIWQDLQNSPARDKMTPPDNLRFALELAIAERLEHLVAAIDQAREDLHDRLTDLGTSIYSAIREDRELRH